MAWPLLLTEADRLAFSISSPTRTENIIITTNDIANILYVGVSSLVNLNPNSTIQSLNTGNAYAIFDIAQSNFTWRGRIIADNGFSGDGALISNVPFQSLTGTIQPTQFAYNTVPFLALSQYGTLTIIDGGIQVGGTIQGTTGTFNTINANTMAISNLTIPGNLSFSNASTNQIAANTVQTTTLVATSAFITQATLFNISNDNFFTGTLVANIVSTNSLSINSFTTPLINIVDNTFNETLPLTAQYRRLTFNGNELLDASDSFIFNCNINSISNDFYSYSNVNASSFFTAFISSTRTQFSTANTITLLARDIACSTITASTFFISTVTGNDIIANTITTQSHQSAFLSTTLHVASTISTVNVYGTSGIFSNVIAGSFFTSSFGGALADALITQTQVYTQNLAVIQSNVTTVEIRASNISIPIPISTERPGRTLIFKDTIGALSSNTPVILYTLGFDQIDGIGFSITLTRPYSFLILQASPSSKWLIVATNKYDTLDTNTLTLSNTTFTTINQGALADPVLTQISANGSNQYPVGQRVPLRTSNITMTSNITTTVDDISTYYFMRNTNPSQSFTLFLPNSNTLPNGWSITVNFDVGSSNYMYVRDINTAQYNFLMAAGQTRQIVYSAGVFYALGGSPPFGIF